MKLLRLTLFIALALLALALLLSPHQLYAAYQNAVMASPLGGNAWARAVDRWLLERLL